MLLTDAFGGFGGIAKFNRDFLTALGQCQRVTSVNAFPRLIDSEIVETIPEAVIYDRPAAKGKGAFAKRVLRAAFSKPRSDLVICGHLNLLSLAWLLAEIQGAQLALIIHGIEAWKPSKQLASNAVIKKISSFISVSHLSAERFSIWSGVDMKRGTILPNSVDCSQFAPGPRDPRLQKRYGIENRRVIMTVGRIESRERYKGFDEIIDIMPQLAERFPELCYLILGDGPDRSRLEQKCKSASLDDRVIFAGRIPEKEKAAHYNLADAYVMPSRGEGFGIVLIEAAACGLPIVGSIKDGSREALLEGHLGQLVDPDNRNELIAAICRALEDRMPHQQIPAVKYFSIERFQERVENWINSLTEVNSPSTASFGTCESSLPPAP